MVLRCNKCGAKLAGDARFCPKCGEVVRVKLRQADTPDQDDTADVQVYGQWVGPILGGVLISLVGGIALFYTSFVQPQTGSIPDVIPVVGTPINSVGVLVMMLGATTLAVFATIAAIKYIARR